MGKNKFFYDLKVLENKPLLPSTIKALLVKLEDYGFVGLEVKELAGTVEKAGDGYVFTARGSKQASGLKPTADLKKLVDGGKTAGTLTGMIAQGDEKGAKPSIEVAEAKETAK